MGMFDDIKFEDVCPRCGNKVDTFQSKDGPCMMSQLDFWDVNNFYASCTHCHTWIEYSIIKRPNRELKIEDYEKEVKEASIKRLEKNAEWNPKIREFLKKCGNSEGGQWKKR